MTSRCVFCEKSEFRVPSCDNFSKPCDSFESHWQERSKQKKIIKLNYDAQRFVYNSYVGRNRTSYHAKRYLAVKQSNAMPFAFSALMHTII